MRRLEEKIQSLTKDLDNVKSTLRGMNGGSGGSGHTGSTSQGGGGGGGGGRNPADAAQPEIKEMINSIQNKLDQLDNRTQVLWGSGAVHCLANGTDDGLVERPGWVEENDKFIQPSLTCILRWLPVFPK